MTLEENPESYQSGYDFAQSIITTLSSTGFDPQEAVPLNIFLYLPSEASAIECGEQLIQSFNMEVTVSESATPTEGLEWLCWSKGEFAPSNADRLEELGNHLIQMETQHQGLLDGWDTGQPEPSLLGLLGLPFRLIQMLFTVCVHCILPATGLIQGFKALDKSQPEKALKIADKVIGSQPEDGDAYQLRGHAYIQLKEYDKAVEAFNQAIDRTPEPDADDSEAHEAMGELHMNTGAALDESGQHQEAIHSYSRSLEYRPEHPTTYFNIANAYANLKDRDQCLSFLKYGIYLNPGLLNKARNDKDFQAVLSPEDFDSLV